MWMMRGDMAPQAERDSGTAQAARNCGREQANGDSLPHIPPHQLMRFLDKLRGEINDIQRVIEKAKPVETRKTEMVVD
jgi:hypothetical protein